MRPLLFLVKHRTIPKPFFFFFFFHVINFKKEKSATLLDGVESFYFLFVMEIVSLMIHIDEAVIRFQTITVESNYLRRFYMYESMP